MKRLLFALIITYHSLSASWHERKCEGWAYYEEKSPQQQEELKKETSPSVTLNEHKQEMENAFSKAVLDPTEENIHTYLQLQNKWLKRASELSQVWAKVVLDHPEFDNSLNGIPMSSYGAKFYHRQKSLQMKKKVKELSKTHNLLCFYEGKSEASKEFAKVISLFSKRYDWLVQYICVDEHPLEELKGSVLDKGLKEQLEIEHFPAVYAINPSNNEAKPIGFGLISVDIIESNISLQY